METFLTTLYENTTVPFLSAFILGLLTAIGPCSMATNITAIGFISRDIDQKGRVFAKGIIYTLGRATSYWLLAFLLFVGADQFKIAFFLQTYGEKLIGPLLIIVGLIMLEVIKINFPGFSKWSEKLKNRNEWNFRNVFLLGIVFALAFCPYSGAFYFGMLIPMSISSAQGLVLPLAFAVATGIPVIIFAWLIAFSVGSIGNLYNKMKTFEIWFRRVIAVLFIGVGVYYILILLVLPWIR